jgi:hypothetical protein
MTELAFTHELSSHDHVYAEWEAQALGVSVRGLTALTPDATARVSQVALHHRPLEAVRRFPAGLSHRVG